MAFFLAEGSFFYNYFFKLINNLMALLGFLGKDKKESLDKGLEKTKESVFHKLSRAVAGKSKVDEEVLDNLEEVLVSSDVGVATTLNIIEANRSQGSKR